MAHDFEQLAAKYLADPLHCPFCGSDEISNDNDDIDIPRVYQPAQCDACGQEWTDGYSLDSVQFKAEDEGMQGFHYKEKEV